MHLHYDPVDFMVLAGRAYHLPDPQDDKDWHELFDDEDGEDPRDSAVGIQVEDPQGNVGIITMIGGRLWIRLLVPNAAGEGVIPFQAGNYKLGNGEVVTLDQNAGVFRLTQEPSATGSGGIGLSGQIALLEKQAELARANGDHAREADFRNQIEVLKLNQEFQAGENVLSRENQVVLQQLQNLSSLQRQILSDKARGRELLVDMIGNDPIRAGALAQGLTPRRGTPADIFKGELQRTVDQPLVQPASTGIADINAAVQETQGNLGLPSPGSLGFNPIQSAAHGAVIDMKKQKGQFRVLVGEQGPELLEGNRSGIQITPIATAQGGGRISFTESPFATFDVPGFGAGPTRATATPRSLGARPQLGATTAQPGSPSIPTFQEILQELQGLPPTASIAPPAVGPPVAPPPAVTPPISTIQDIEFERPGGELVQGLESVFDFLGFDRVPTFTEGPFGGMQVPTGGLSAFNALGIDPSLLRTTEDGRGTNFFRTPSGELQQISTGGLFQQALGLGPGTDSGFGLEDFLTVDASDIGRRAIAGATPFTGQGLASADDPFPTPRAPLAVPSPATGGPGFFLPDPRVIASLWPRLPESVKQNLLSAYGLSETQRGDVLQRLNFFTPQGSFRNVAGFG